MASLRRQLLTTYAAEGVNLVCGLTFGILAARALEPAGRGVVAAAWAAAGISVMWAGLGVSKALITRLNDRADARSSAEYFGALLAMLPVMTLGAWAIMAPLLPDFPPTERWIALLVVFAAPPVMLATEAARGVLRARRRIGQLNLMVAGAALLRVAALAALWRLNAVSIAVVLGIELAYFLVIGAAAAFALRRSLAARPRFRGVPATVKLLVASGLGYQVYALVFNMIGRSGVPVTHHLLGDAPAGYYAVGSRLAEYVATFANQVVFVLLPYLAQQTNTEAMLTKTVRAARLSILFLTPAAAILAIAAPWLVPWLYGAAFAPAVPIMRMILLASCLAVVVQLLASGAVASGNMRMLNLGAVAGLATALSAMLVASGRWGATGVAAATAAGYAVTLGVLLVSLQRRAGVRPLDVLIPRPDDLRALLRRGRP